MKNKLIAFLVLAIFIVSIIPAAFAENDSGKIEDNDVEDVEKTELESSDDSNVETEDSNESEVDDSNDGSSDSSEKGAKGFDKAALKMRLEEAKQKFEEAKNRYEEAKEKYSKAKEKFEERKSYLLEMKDKVSKCFSDSKDCVEKKLQLKGGVKNHLLASLDVMDKFLTRTKEKVGNSTEIGALIVKVADQRTKVEALSNESTADEYKAVIKETKGLWNEVRSLQKELVGDLINEKTSEALDKYTSLERSMQAKIETIERRGGDAAELKELLSEYQTKVAVAKEKYNEAKNAWKNAEDKNAVAETWREAQKDVRKEMKEARDIVRDFVKKFVELNKSLNSGNATKETADTASGDDSSSDDTASTATAQ